MDTGPGSLHQRLQDAGLNESQTLGIVTDWLRDELCTVLGTEARAVLQGIISDIDPMAAERERMQESVFQALEAVSSVRSSQLEQCADAAMGAVATHLRIRAQGHRLIAHKANDPQGHGVAKLPIAVAKELLAIADMLDPPQGD